MISELVNLNEVYPSLPKGVKDAVLQVCCRSYSGEYGSDRKYPALIICPGGAYAFTSDREAEPIALCFLARGVQCFVLRYSVAPARYPTAQNELAAAFRYVRENAERFQVDTDAISTLGFSAGGHLVGSYCTHWQEGDYAKAAGTDIAMTKPNGMVLCYGVLTTGEYTHDGTIKNLLGGNDSPEMREFLSTDKHVCADTPPAFIWHTFTDPAVPIANCMLVGKALADNGIPFEMHIYPEGTHGLATSNWLTCGSSPRRVERWINDCADWMLELFNYDRIK